MAARRRRPDAARSPLPWAPAGPPAAVEWLEEGWHLRLVQPYQARKVYRCPGCDHEIFPGTLHVVAWPDGGPDERRHWHRPCWARHAAELGRRRRR
jgi:hypothetical protein